MNRILTAVVFAALAAAPMSAADAPKPAAKTAKPKAAAPAAASSKSETESTVYAWGYKVGQNLSPIGFSEAELKSFVTGLREGATGKPAAVNMEVYLPKVGELQQARVAAKSAAESAPNKKKGAEFAEAFSKEAGVKPIAKGGFYKSLTEGTGAAPTAADTVKVNYRGTLLDGSEFDSSYKRGQPASFPLGAVIPCWTNGVAMMRVGGKAKLVCPSEVAYGDQGHPPVIPGGSTLVFEVELLEVIHADAPNGDAPKGGKSPVKK